MSQTNVKIGDFAFTAHEDLTGMEDRLVKLYSDHGAAFARLPDVISDHAYFLILEGAQTGKQASLRPLEPGRSVRLALKGVCSAGSILVLADPSVGADRGKVRQIESLPAGTYRGVAIAQEAGVDGQLVLCRPAMIGNITI